jgi:hypothetical protein
MDRKASDKGDIPVKNLISGAELIAPSCFVPAKMKDQPQSFNSRAELFDWLTLDEGTTLPAFTSPRSCRDFVKTYWAGDSQAMPRLLLRDVFTLAEVLEHLEGVERIVFDPEATATGAWSNPQSTMSASYLCRFAREIRSDAESLFEEAEAQVGGDWFRNPDDLLKIKERCEPSMWKAVCNAHARAEEWEVKDS